jgi:hypothetical protein
MKSEYEETDLFDVFSLPEIHKNHFLKCIWQGQYFDKRSLTLENGDKFEIINPGKFNMDQPNSFLEAKIKIENTLWVGKVELYAKTSDLIVQKPLHNQSEDKVLLYVVWDHDQLQFDLGVPIFHLKTSIPNIKIGEAKGWDKRNKKVDKPQPIKVKANKQVAKNLKVEVSPNKEITEVGNEVNVSNCLGIVNRRFKKKPIIAGKVHTIKITTWLRQTENFQVEFGGCCKHVPKLLLLGNWLIQAGFNCEDKVYVVPLTNMLIIIPQKQ